jgi:hypothetical protein
MATNTLPPEERIDEKPPIEGPIAEFDEYDRPTGYGFFRCTGCGVEAMDEGTVALYCRCP